MDDEFYPVVEMPSLQFEQEIGRRSVLAALGVGAGLGAGTALGATDYTADRRTGRAGPFTTDEWPSFMHAAENTGYNPHASLASPDLTVRWRFGPRDTATDSEANDFGPPVYAGDTVYVGGYERLWAIDAADGSEQWRYNPDPSPPSDADVTAVGTSGGSVFVGTDHGRVAAVSADTGDEQWGQRIATGDVGGDGEGEAVRIRGLTAAEGYVLAVEDGTADEPSVLHALDAANGAELWQREGGTEDPTDPVQPPPPAIHDGVVYDAADGLVALEAGSGTVKWGPRPPETNDLPAYSDGTIFVSGGPNGDAYWAVNATNGNTEWATPFDDDSNTGARLSVVDNERVYAGHETEELNRLIAFDRVNGEKVWTNDTAADAGRGAFSVDAAVLYANKSGGSAIVALDPTNGRILWEYTGMDRATVPAVVDSTAYIGGPKVVAIGARSTPTPTSTQAGSPTPTETSTGTTSPTSPTESPTPTGTGATDTPTAGSPTPTRTNTPTPTTAGEAPTPSPTEAFGAGGSPNANGTAPGLGILATVGGLLGTAAYLRHRYLQNRSRRDGSESDE